MLATVSKEEFLGLYLISSPHMRILDKIHDPIIIQTHGKLFDPEDGYFVLSIRGEFHNVDVATLHDFMHTLAEMLVHPVENLTIAGTTLTEIQVGLEVSVSTAFNWNVPPEVQKSIEDRIPS